MTHPAILEALGGFPPSDEQHAAITHPPTPLGVIAGAGSGKTAVMAARIAHLILSGTARPSQILGLTFTNKAAHELRERVTRCLAHIELPPGEEATIYTYNSFADRLLRDYGPKIGIEPDVALLSTAQSLMLLERLLENMAFHKLEVRWVPKIISDARHLADACSNHLIDPQDVARADIAMLEELQRQGGKPQYKLLKVLDERPEIARLAYEYIMRKRELGRIDYGDQITFAFKLVDEHPEVAKLLLERWPYVLLDEYQDTNVAQRRLMTTIYPKGSAVTVVGDPDQAIYGWRGATLHNILSFGEHYPDADGAPAASRTLQTSYRSGQAILAVADAVIGEVPQERRGAPKVLKHFPATGAGEVTMDLVASQRDEALVIARQIKSVAGEEVPEAERIPLKEIAILCRKRKLFGPIGTVLREEGIPVEIVGLGGLLTAPEVIDLLAYLRLIVRPSDNVSFARIAMGPRWRIHYRDMAALARWAAVNTGDFKQRLQEIEADEHAEVDPGEMRFSLSEAIGRLPELEGLSPEAARRLQRMNGEFERMRSEARGLTLAESVESALMLSGIETELRAAGTPVAKAALANLSSFLDAAAQFAPLEGEASLEAFLEYLAAAEESEDLEIAQPQEEDSVKLMTVHQAKGLEYDVVFVPGLAKATFPDTKISEHPLRTRSDLPYQIREDRGYLPEFSKVMSHFEAALKERAMEEERRLAYVAFTRARKHLHLSCAWWYGEERVTSSIPGEFFEQLAGRAATEEREAVPRHQSVVVRRVDERPDENPLVVEIAKRAKEWPPSDISESDDLFPEGWRAAAQKAVADPTSIDDILAANAVPRDEFTTAKDVVAEQLALVTAPAAVPKQDDRLKSLSVSNMVQLARCPKQFYWSVVRPLPRRPSKAARLGNEIHRWIEIKSIGQQRLDDPEEPPDLAPEEVGDRPGRTLPSEASLKKAFEDSRFAEKRPRYIEQPFVISLDNGYLVRGRIDAVYVEGDKWELVDYKTGMQPAEDDEIAKLQLAIYALAAQRIWGIDPADITVTYFYLKSGNMVSTSASDLSLSEKDLIAMFERVEAREFEPVPTPICHSCDFLRFCDAGKAYVAAAGSESG